MEDWKRKLFNEITPYFVSDDKGTAAVRRGDFNAWCKARGLSGLSDLSNPQHVAEIMEMIDRWRDEDAANKPCATPAPPANPFLIERVEREIARGSTDLVTVKGVNHQFVNIKITEGTYYPKNLRDLAKQLTDLADAHEAVYPPQQHPDDL